MRRPAGGEHLVAPRDLVVEAEARPAQLPDARMDLQAVVEVRRRSVPDVRLEHERLEPGLAQSRITAGELLQVRDARDLEPDEVVRVVRDALGVRLGEPNAHVGAEAEARHHAALYGGDCARRSASRTSAV